MITYTKGNILESKLETITCPVNCVGVMGKGLALKFKETIPGLAVAHANACKGGFCKIGCPWIYWVNDVRQVLCFPSKDHWRRPSTLDYIERGLVGVVKLHSMGEIHSLALPPLGCGLGGLAWSEVKPLIEKHLGNLEMIIEVYEP